MSERGSFTTQYFYNDSDYQVIRKALDRKGKYLCVSPPATWNNGEQPIVSGKVGELSMNMEWDTIANALEGIVTNEEVRVVVMCDSGGVFMVRKSPEGEVRIRGMVEENDYD